jgi:hypothetical protein
MYSVMESAEMGHDYNYESLEDSAIDAINYLSFFVEYSRKKMDGQDTKRNMFNRIMDFDGLCFQQVGE